MGTGVFTVPTESRKGYVELWVRRVQRVVWSRIGEGLIEVGFAGMRECPQFAQGLREWWKSGRDRRGLSRSIAWLRRTTELFES